MATKQSGNWPRIGLSPPFQRGMASYGTMVLGCALLLGCGPVIKNADMHAGEPSAQSRSGPPQASDFAPGVDSTRSGAQLSGDFHQADHDEEIFFPPRSGQWLSTELSKLDNIADRLKGNMALQVTLTGLTEPLGSRAYSITIASQRVDNIKAYLRRKGVRLSQIVSYPMGYSSKFACLNGPCKPGGNARVLVRYGSR